MKSLCHCKCLERARQCFTLCVSLSCQLGSFSKRRGKERQSSLLSLFHVLLAQLPQLPLLPFCGGFLKQAVLYSLPVTVDPNVCSNIDEWTQNSLEQSSWPSLQEVGHCASTVLGTIFQSNWGFSCLGSLGNLTRTISAAQSKLLWKSDPFFSLLCHPFLFFISRVPPLLHNSPRFFSLALPTHTVIPSLFSL